MTNDQRQTVRRAGVRIVAVFVAWLAIASVLLGAAQPAPVPQQEPCLAGGTDAARGTEVAREPDFGTADEVPLEAQAHRGSGFRARVPTYVHVVSPDGVEGDVSPSKIREQIHVLDLSFAGSYGGFDTGFDFQLVAVDRTVNADWYSAGPTTNGERDMKRALHQGGPDALNIYLTTAGPYLGWSYFPSIVTKPGQAYLDGIVIDWKSLPGMGFYPRFDLGLTATHETGHWLNLYHTFQGGCNHWGDHVADTPPQRTPSFGCPVGKDTCSDPGADPIHNFMDYSDDPCYMEFTAGQAARMQDAWAFWRA